VSIFLPDVWVTQIAFDAFCLTPSENLLLIP
jgi:hypothetical protein